MRKLIVSAIAAATLLPAGTAFAQSRQEVRHDNREVQKQREHVQDARTYGNRGDVREAREELREARQERREDWRDYRRMHRNVYTMPRYTAPRGYSYHPVRVGVSLNPAFYGQRY